MTRHSGRSAQSERYAWRTERSLPLAGTVTPMRQMMMPIARRALAAGSARSIGIKTPRLCATIATVFSTA
jgi:hypothetical protein